MRQDRSYGGDLGDDILSKQVSSEGKFKDFLRKSIYFRVFLGGLKVVEELLFVCPHLP